MKRKLVALLVLIAVLCWTTGAMAQVTYDIPLTADEVGIPDEVIQGILDCPTVEFNFDGDIFKEVVFSRNPFVEQIGNDDGASVVLNFDYGNYLVLSADDLTQNANGQYVYALENDVTIDWNVELRVCQTAVIDGIEWEYDCFYNGNQDSSIWESYHVWQNVDPETYQRISYSYRDNGGQSRHPYLEDVNYPVDDTPLRRVMFNSDGTLYLYEYEVEPNYRVQFNAYGEIEYADYQKPIGMSEYGYEIYQTYYWREEDGWQTWDETLGETISVDTPEGVTPLEDIVPPVVAKTRPGYNIAENVSSYALPPITPADMPDFEDVVIEGTTCTVTLTGDPFANDYSSAEGYVQTGFSLSYEVDDEYYWMDIDVDNIHIENGSFSFDVPEGAMVSYARMRSYIEEYDSSYRFQLVKDSDGWNSVTLSNWEEGSTYYYQYDDAGNVTSVEIYDEYHGSYINYYNTDGTLQQYSIQVADGYSITYLPDGTISNASYQDESYNWFNWDSEIGWYTWEYDASIEDYVEVPCDAPEGVADPTTFKAPFTVAPPKPAYNWYPNNTVGVLGLSLRDDLNLSDKWYNVVPIDLSIEGRQTVRLVASNMYYFGAAVIDVADGTVTVNYTFPNGGVYPKSECLKWFTSLDEITADFLANPQSELAFGEPVSIADDLDGAQTALLFICNRVTYRQPLNNSGDALVRYYNMNPEWVSYRATLQTMLKQMTPEQVEAADSATASDVPADEASETISDIAEETEATPADDTADAK